MRWSLGLAVSAVVAGLVLTACVPGRSAPPGPASDPVAAGLVVTSGGPRGT